MATAEQTDEGIEPDVQTAPIPNAATSDHKDGDMSETVNSKPKAFSSIGSLGEGDLSSIRDVKEDA